MQNDFTADDLTRAVNVAWVAALLIAATLSVPVFLLHRRLVRTTNMRVLPAVVAIPCSLAVYVLAGMSFIDLVDYQMRGPETAESGYAFSAMSIYYHPGLTIKLSLLGAVMITWIVLVWWDRRT